MAKQPRVSRLLTHGQVWTALDRLAERAGLSPSGLARRAGLDPTTFNKSKRVTADGRERWPSTESIAKALAATGSSIESFVLLIGDGPGVQSVPLTRLSQAGADGRFDDNGFPAGPDWDEVTLPSAHDENAYALEVSGDQLQPAYRDGDILVVSPGTPIRRGDRVVVRIRTGEVMVRELKRRAPKTLELQAFDPARTDRVIAADDVAWIARIIWVKQ